MCGIAGFITLDHLPGQNDRKNYMEDAMHCGTLRGTDSTGLMHITHANELGTFKHTLAGPDFMQLREPKRTMDNISQYKAVVGHHRAKNSGTILRIDAHPHYVDNICLVHNGYINNHHSLPGWEYDVLKPSVDSYRVAHSIARKGAVETLERAEGAYALVWWDTIEDSLYMARNKERPLALCWADNKRTLLFASEWGMLGWLMQRNHIKPTGDVWELREHVIYKFTNEEKQIAVEKTAYKFKAKEETHRTQGNPKHWYNNFTDADDYHDGWQEFEPGDRPTDLPVVVRPPMSHLPAVRKIQEEAETVAEAEIVELDSKSGQLSKNKVKKLNRSLHQIDQRLSYDCGVWGIPKMWAEYKPAIGPHKKGFGFATFEWFRGQGLQIQVHNITQEAWRHIIRQTIIVALRVTGVTRINNDALLMCRLDIPNPRVAWGIVDQVPEDNDDIRFIPFKFGDFISKKRFLELTKNGCTMCKQAIPMFDADEVNWIGEGLPVCVTCGSDKDKEELVNGN